MRLHSQRRVRHTWAAVAARQINGIVSAKGWTDGWMVQAAWVTDKCLCDAFCCDSRQRPDWLGDVRAHRWS
jgi:hypothetical protein